MGYQRRVHGDSHTDMKFLILAALAAVASARPRYLVIDLDAMEDPRAVEMMMPRLARTARMAQDEENYQAGPSYQAYDRSDSEPAGSNAYSAPAASAGPDHVDYGAYTEDMEHSDGILTILYYLLDTRIIVVGIVQSFLLD